jgi:hypothetical protein
VARVSFLKRDPAELESSAGSTDPQILLQPAGSTGGFRTSIARPWREVRTPILTVAGLIILLADWIQFAPALGEQDLL